MNHPVGIALRTLASRRARNTVAATIVVGVTAAALAGAGVRSLERRELEHAGEALAVASSSIADELAVVVHARVTDVSLLAMGILGTANPIGAAWAYLAALEEGSALYLWLGMADASGKIVAATDPSSIGWEYGGSEWFRTARGADTARILGVQTWQEVASTPVLPVVSAMDGGANGFHGALVALIGMSPIEAMVARRTDDLMAQLSPASHIDWLLVNDAGVVIADSSGERVGADLRALGLNSASLSDSLESGHVEEPATLVGPASITGYAHVSGATNAEDLHWRILLSRPRSEVLTPLWQALRMTALLVAALLVPTLAAIFWAGRARRHAEAAKALAHARLQAIVDNAHDAIVVADHEGRIRDFNPAAERMFGWARADVIGCEVAEVLVPEVHREAHRRGLERYLQSGQATLGRPIELSAQRRDGTTFAVDLTLVQLPTTPPLFSAVIRDIEQRRQLELELRHAQKLESIGQLAAGVAHEMNTPIQFVGDNVRFLDDGVKDLLSLVNQYEIACGELAERCEGGDLLKGVRRAADEMDLGYLRTEMPKAISQTQDGVQRVATIVRAMRSFAHQKATGEKEPADLNEALRSTLTVGTSLFKYVADVELDLEELPPVTCHLSDLNQVFLNLLANAAHAIEDVVRGSEARGRITVQTRCQGDTVEISIGDTGCGIPEELRARIFDPFFTTKEVGRGTGQGLSIARTIVVEGHGGKLTLESEVGHGTTFRIHLPLVPEITRAAA